MKQIILATLALLIATAVVIAQDQPMPPMMLGGIVKELNLTDQQQKEFDKIKFDLMKSMIAQASKLAMARVDMRQMIKTDSPDQKAIEKKVDEMGDQASQIGKSMLGGWFAVNKILTADQQKTWKKALDIGPMMRGFMRGRMGRGPMPNMGPGMMMEHRMEFMKEKKEREEKEEKR